MEDNRDKDKQLQLCPEKGMRKQPVTKDILKSMFIAEGLTTKELAVKYGLSESMIQRYAIDEQWDELRKAYVISGISKIQNSQLKSAKDLLDFESSFNTLKIKQLEKQLEHYAAYYARFEHLFKVHPTTGEILKDTDGMPIPLRIPDVSKQIRDIKESVNMSEGIKKVIDRLEMITSAGEYADESEGEKPDIIDIDKFDQIFKKRKK